MRQIFFIPKAPHIFLDVPGAVYHIWIDGDQSAGVIEMDGHCDAERVIEALEKQGIEWLPDHHRDQSTLNKMTTLHEKSGFPHLKPKRF